MIKSIEKFIEVKMDNLDFISEDIQDQEPTIVESVDDKPLDWKRLCDCDDSYSSILFDPNR